MDESPGTVVKIWRLPGHPNIPPEVRYFVRWDGIDDDSKVFSYKGEDLALKE